MTNSKKAAFNAMNRGNQTNLKVKMVCVANLRTGEVVRVNSNVDSEGKIELWTLVGNNFGFDSKGRLRDWQFTNKEVWKQYESAKKYALWLMNPKGAAPASIPFPKFVILQQKEEGQEQRFAINFFVPINARSYREKTRTKLRINPVVKERGYSKFELNYKKVNEKSVS